MVGHENLENVLTENEYQIISNSLYDNQNLKRKSDLNLDEVNSCLISHVLHWIRDFTKRNKRKPYLVEIMQFSAITKESLSLSRGGKALDIFKDIMTTEVHHKRKRFKDKEESD